MKITLVRSYWNSLRFIIKSLCAITHLLEKVHVITAGEKLSATVDDTFRKY